MKPYANIFPLAVLIGLSACGSHDDPKERTSVSINAKGDDAQSQTAEDLQARLAVLDRDHRLCVAQYSKRDAEADAKAALEKGNIRVFAELGDENTRMVAMGIRSCFHIKPQFARTSLENEKTYERGGHPPFSRQCSDKMGEYMIKYNQYIHSHTKNFELITDCNPMHFVP